MFFNIFLELDNFCDIKKKKVSPLEKQELFELAA